MNDYDFSTLNDKEFENLSIELISEDKDKRFERFKAGRDGGIDGRFCHDDGSQEIIQCKHSLKSGFSGLMSSLKKKNDNGINESDKVNKLAPLKEAINKFAPSKFTLAKLALSKIALLKLANCIFEENKFELLKFPKMKFP